MAELAPTLVTALGLAVATILFVAVFMVWSGLTSFETHFGRGAFASVGFGAILVFLVNQFEPEGLGAALVISASVIVVVALYGLSRDAIAWLRGEYTQPKGPFET